MRPFYVILILILTSMSGEAQNRDKERMPAVSGSFYPGNERQLSAELEKLFDNVTRDDFPWAVRAIISPHAGYTFSGSVAASAFSSIPETFDYENVFIIGSSHRVSFAGASVYREGYYITPLGRLKVNADIAQDLIENSSVFSYYPQAHETEHSIEVQLPFLQFRFGNDIPIVPVIIGSTNTATCKNIANALQPYFNNKNLFIISSDFSHYPPYDIANELDKETADNLMAGDPDRFIEYMNNSYKSKIDGLATRMCGWTSGLVLLYLTDPHKSLEYKHITYKNSGDTPYGDRSGVVGYHAIAVVDNNPGTKVIYGNKEAAFSLSNEDEKDLIEIARNNIRSVLYEGRYLETDPSQFSQKLHEPLGAFVTLNLDGKLRGCIGRFIPDEPLFEVVKQMSASAAFSDTRFTPLTKDEFEKVTIEISVLGPLKKVSNIDEIELGKHGVYLRNDTRSGTFLPQVAEGKDWTVEEFLGYLARDKAGLGWNGWKDAEIFVYEAYIFGENH
ncbi:MAG TPA: AmmeMemoRadiSam system protein B [Bacteroidales bacterium]|nr:AmmeMemoRadiSam system protein B [Bacteroidales bacterium]